MLTLRRLYPFRRQASARFASKMKLHRSINTSAPRRLLLQDHAPAAVNASRASATNSTSSSSSKATAIPPPNNPYYPKNHNSSSDTSPDSSANTDAVRFDSSSVAVTALVILSALFFLGFFSVYARRFFAPEWESSETAASRRRRLARRGRMMGASGRGGAYPHGAPRGLDPDAIKALPLIRYSAPADVVKGTMGSKDVARKEGSAGADEEMEDGDIHRCCAVCLGEFEEGEELRAIPGCGHAFHKECIDAWLAAHGSCPLCRTTDLFGTANQQAKIDPVAVLAQGQRVTCDVCRLESVVVVRPVDEGAGSGQEEGGGGQRRLDRDVDNGDRQPAAATATAPMASPEARGVGGMGRSRSWLCMSAEASEAADEEKGPPPPASVVREEQPQPPRRSYS